MGDIKGFLKYTREEAPERPVADRIKDWQEIPRELPTAALQHQGARCMDCGVPFCHTGCPLGNIIPDFNDFVYRDQWKDAIDRLHATNNFPEFTGRVCPAPCETACVLGINQPPVTIKQLEHAIIDRAWEEGWIVPQPPSRETGKRVAVVGSGPAGLAAAQQLCRAGHQVTVFERSDRIGGLLMYGIPDFKLEKINVQRRVEQMTEEGVIFKPGVNVGKDFPVSRLNDEFDAILLAGGATQARALSIDGHKLKGVHLAMDFLTQQNKLNQGDTIPAAQRISAAGKHVIVLGGGDTGSDCVGTSIRQGAKSVTQIELLSRPADGRTDQYPWPYYPMLMRTSTSQEEGCERHWSITTERFGAHPSDATRVGKLHATRIEWVQGDGGRPQMQKVENGAIELDADLVLLALGFTGPEKEGLITELGVKLDDRGNVEADENYQTSNPKIFAAGDLRRGQSLVVWALAEGREAARGIDQYLMGRSDLPTLETRMESLPRR